MSSKARSGQSGASSAGLLAGQTAVVTGASTGIGRAIALALAEQAADVAVTYRRSSDAARGVAEEIRALGREAAVFQVDLAEEAAIERLVDAVFERFGRVDVWVNNAGADILTGEGAQLPDRAKLDRLIAVDLRGTILASWLAAERMRRQGGGVILNMSWDHVLSGMPDRNPEMFAAVKGGILSFSKSLARSVAPEVRVNVLAPGWIRTAFGATAAEELHRAVVESTPLRRWGTPEDVARAAVFLASSQSEFLTGATLLINGGVVM